MTQFYEDFREQTFTRSITVVVECQERSHRALIQTLPRNGKRGVTRAFPDNCDVATTLKVSPRDAFVASTPLPCLHCFNQKTFATSGSIFFPDSNIIKQIAEASTTLIQYTATMSSTVVHVSTDGRPPSNQTD